MTYEFREAFEVPGKPIGDAWYKKLIIRVYGDILPFEQGDSVTIKSGLYSGTHKIGYIYKGFSSANGKFYNLYFPDLDYVGAAAGYVSTTLSGMVYSSAESLIEQIRQHEELVAAQEAEAMQQLQLESSQYETEDLAMNSAVPAVGESILKVAEPTDPEVPEPTVDEQIKEIAQQVETTADTAIQKANKIPDRWFYFILFAIGLAAFIYFQTEN